MIDGDPDVQETIDALAEKSMMSGVKIEERKSNYRKKNQLSKQHRSLEAPDFGYRLSLCSTLFR